MSLRDGLLATVLVFSSCMAWPQAATPAGALEEMVTTDQLEVFTRHLPMKLLDALNTLDEREKKEILAEFHAKTRNRAPNWQLRKSSDGSGWEMVNSENQVVVNIMLEHSFISGSDALLELVAHEKAPTRKGTWEHTSRGFVRMKFELGEWRVIEFGEFHPEKNFESEEFVTYAMPITRREAAAASMLRTLDEALLTYAHTYADDGYPREFKQLSGLSDQEPSRDHAMLLPSEFMQEHVIQGGYEFRYSRFGDGYRITATPLEYGKTGKRSFFSDETTVLRFTSEDRPADNNDKELDSEN